MCMKVANGVNDVGICINTRGLNSNEDDICGAQVNGGLKLVTFCVSACNHPRPSSKYDIKFGLQSYTVGLRKLSTRKWL